MLTDLEKVTYQVNENIISLFMVKLILITKVSKCMFSMLISANVPLF